MSYKFNRDCWVESLEERLLCSPDAGSLQSDAGGEKTHGECSGDAGVQDETIPGRSPMFPAAIEEIIAGAEGLFVRWGVELGKDERIRRLAKRLSDSLEDSRIHMHDLGIFEACARCDASVPEGSCCSRGLERKYTPTLLLMNLMLGAQLPARRLREDSCYFLGFQGCVLKVRHMLCIDYLCPELEAALGRGSLIEIQGVSGVEIESAFLLQEAIKEKIRSLLP